MATAFRKPWIETFRPRTRATGRPRNIVRPARPPRIATVVWLNESTPYQALCEYPLTLRLVHANAAGGEGFEIDVENESHVFGFMVTYKEEDLAKMRLRVTDGEGHDHWTGLTKDSVPNVRAIINERTRRKEERRAGKDPDGRA